ncbi:MAG TPA: DUF192 domain-containing protein [Patescibacteria group bacterium]
MVTITVQSLKSIKDKTFGLLGSKKAHPVLIKTRFGIHTFGLKFPIDVVILDKRNTIKAVQNDLKPNKLFFWNPIYDGVLELPKGMIQELGLRTGMPLVLQTM